MLQNNQHSFNEIIVYCHPARTGKFLLILIFLFFVLKLRDQLFCACELIVLIGKEW
jgi:hypothetical protein